MKFLRAEPREGVAWVRDGFRVFRRQPFGLAVVFGLCSVVAMLLSLVPLLGEGLPFAVAPLASLIFMIAGQRTAVGERPLPDAFSVISNAGRDRLRELAKLGIVYALSVVASSLIVAAVDAGTTAAWMDAMRKVASTPPAPGMPINLPLPDPRAVIASFSALLLLSLLSIPFWHAPGLVFWGRQGWAKSLFFSTVALWRNKGAFSLYGLAWIALSLVLAVIVNIVMALFGAGQPGTGPAGVITLSGVAVYLTLMYCSLWATFAGCFDVSTTEADAPAP